MGSRFTFELNIAKNTDYMNFCLKHFLIQVIGIFDSIESWNESTFPFQYIIIFQKWQSLDHSPLHFWMRWRRVFTEFFVGNLILNNFYLNHFSLVALSLKVNWISSFSTLWYFKHGNLWSPLAPLPVEIKICAHWLFCRKFNSEQFCFEAFFIIISIFCSIQP